MAEEPPVDNPSENQNKPEVKTSEVPTHKDTPDAIKDEDTSSKETKDQSAPIYKKHWYSKWDEIELKDQLMIIFTGVLTIATIFLAIYTYKLVHDSMEQTETFREQAKVAYDAMRQDHIRDSVTNKNTQRQLVLTERSIQNTQHNFQIQNTPLVKMYDIVIESLEKGEPIKIIITTKNVGTLPAMDYQVFSKLEVIDNFKEMDYSKAGLLVQREAIGADEESGAVVANTRLKRVPEDLDSIMMKKKFLVYYGYVSFKDAFRTLHRQYYFWYYSPEYKTFIYGEPDQQSY